jgi:hypothetical protein
VRWGIVAVGVVLLSAVCGDPPDSPDDELRDLIDFKRLCEEDGVGYDSAAAFRGPAPHPVVAVEVDGDGCASSIVSDDGAEGDAARYLGPRPEAIQDAVAELVAG